MAELSLYGKEPYGDSFYSDEAGIFVQPPEIWTPVPSVDCDFGCAIPGPVKYSSMFQTAVEFTAAFAGK